jgi:hypothetical protein
MLAGQDDARMLDHFIKNFSSRFAEQDGRVHGAYGKRWKNWFMRDQLEECIRLLRENPLDRQCVIQHWDADNDLGVPGLNDRPCNTHIYLRIVDGALDLTTMARSHDAIFGATGANAVHFTMLQEYLAAGIGCEVGKFYQFSNNYHVYTDVFQKTSWGDAIVPDSNYYAAEEPKQIVEPSAMVTNFKEFDTDLRVFLEGDWCAPHKPGLYVNRWFAEVLTPVVAGGLLWRAGARTEALEAASSCEASDWRLACQQWMHRRMKK